MSLDRNRSRVPATPEQAQYLYHTTTTPSYPPPAFPHAAHSRDAPAQQHLHDDAPTTLPPFSPPLERTINSQQSSSNFNSFAPQSQVAQPPSPPETLRSQSPPAPLAPSRRPPQLFEATDYPTQESSRASGYLNGGGGSSGANRHDRGGRPNGATTGGYTIGRPHGVSSLVNGVSTSLKPKKRWLVLVVPPDVLPHSPPPAAVSGFSNGYGASGRFSSGILLPLQSTLTAQVALIAREFSLPSVAGVSIYLSLSYSSSNASASQVSASSAGYPFAYSATNGVGTYTPRITDETWSILWSSYFDEDDSNAKAMEGVNGLPIAARLEFDIDPRRARWFSAWTQHATATPTPANIFNSTAPSGESSSSSNNQNHSRDPSAPTLVESTMHSRSSSTETEDSGHDAFDPSPLHPFNTRTYPNFRALVSPTLSTTPLARPGYPRRTLSLLANRTSVIQHAASHQPRSPREVQFTSRGQQSTPRQRDMSIDLTNFRLNDSGFVSSSPVLPIHSWPSTPASPDRLPSPDIAERTFIHTPTSTPLPPPPPRQRALVPPTVQTSETSAQQPRKLIERDWNVSVKPLWAISGTPTPTPTRVVFEQSAVTNEAVRSASNSFKSFVDYPTLHIYPSAYPHFSLYPPIHLEPVVELPLFASALRSPPESPVAYPFHLSLIYPSAYPNLHSQLYPSLVPQMPVVNVRRPSTRPPRITLTTSSYPQLTIYPSLSAVDSSYSPQFPPASVDVMPPPLDLNDFDELWPATPPSPDRLPSASLEERLMDSSYGWEEGRFLREQQKPSSVVVEETRAVKKLVERDWEAKVRPLKDVSEPSPAMAERTFEESEEAVTRGVVLDTESEPSPYPRVEFSSLFQPPPSSPTSTFDFTSTTSSSRAPGESLYSPTLNAGELNDRIPSFSIPVGYPDEDVEFVLSPGLEKALALPSAEAQHFPRDDGGDAEEDEGESDYSSDEEEEDEMVTEFLVASGREDQSCMTFDHIAPTPLGDNSPQPTTTITQPPLPILFSFKRDGIADAVCQFVVEAQTQSILRRGRFAIALSGGSMPMILAEGLIGDDRIDWSKWEVFFADERLVPLDDSSSTFGSYEDILFSKVPIPAWQIHSIRNLKDLEKSPVARNVAEEIATDYEQQLMASFPVDLDGPPSSIPRFDLVLLGMGDDGHTASLFPDHPLLTEQDHWISYLLDSPRPPLSRITFTLPLLCASRRLAFICTGASKSIALDFALDEGVMAEEKVPAGRIKLEGHPVVWFCDEEAVEGVRYPVSQFWEDD